VGGRWRRASTPGRCPPLPHGRLPLPVSRSPGWAGSSWSEAWRLRRIPGQAPSSPPGALRRPVDRARMLRRPGVSEGRSSDGGRGRPLRQLRGASVARPSSSPRVGAAASGPSPSRPCRTSPAVRPGPHPEPWQAPRRRGGGRFASAGAVRVGTDPRRHGEARERVVFRLKVARPGPGHPDPSALGVTRAGGARRSAGLASCSLCCLPWTGAPPAVARWPTCTGAWSWGLANLGVRHLPSGYGAPDGHQPARTTRPVPVMLSWTLGEPR